MSNGIAGQGSAPADQAGDGPAWTDAASGEDADGGLETRQGGLRISRMYDWEETKYPAGAGSILHAKRERCEADCCGTDARASRLGELFPDGECRPGVQQNGRLRGEKSAALAVPARRATANQARAIHWRSASWYGFASVDGHREIPGASHTQKVIGKPCAGKRHARFERGILETGGDGSYRAKILPMTELTIGLKHEHNTIVTADLAVNFLGLESARVLGTPFMIMLMEMTSRNCVKPHLPEGFDTVGTVVNIRHLAATPLGAKIRFTSELIGQAGKRVTFKVEAFYETDKIGEGEHERAVIDVARFGARMSEKRQR